MERWGLRPARIALLLAGLWLGLPFAAIAGTTGKLSGRITNRKGEPLSDVNIAVPAARTGGVTGADGRFVIVNLPAETYDVKLNLIGYAPVTVTGVVISADQTTTLNRALEESAVQVQEVVVSAERPVVDVNRTSTLATVSRAQIRELPVQELQDIVNLQAGVVEGHFRGGRVGEVQYQVDGVSVNNAYDNQTSIALDRSLLEEVQVVSGTFDAEYGQAMSGVVNAVLRRGNDHFEWDGELLAGGFYYSEAGKRGANFDLQPFGIDNAQLSLSGPTGLPKTTFLASGRVYAFDDYPRAENVFVPFYTPNPDFDPNNPGDQIPRFPTFGDFTHEPLAWTREVNGIVKLSNRSIPNVELSYQALANQQHGRRLNWAYRYNPGGASLQRTLSVIHGLDLTHTLSARTFYTFSARQNYKKYRDMRYDDLYDDRYLLAGAPISAELAIAPGVSDNIVVMGVDLTRFEQITNAMVYKGTFTTQRSNDLQFKFGGEVQYPRVYFGNPGYLNTSNGPFGDLERVESKLPNQPGVLIARPYFGAAFEQQEVEWNDLRLRAGVRFDFFDARGTVPSDLANPANSIGGVPLSHPVKTTVKSSLSPRIGVSFPVTKDAALFFAYGHFYQMPALGTVFQNSDYNVLSELQAGGIQYGVMGNPDIAPEKTVQYQFGYKQALNPNLGLEANAFYKDIRDLLGVEFIDTYNGATYPRLTNVDFGNVIGVTLSLDRRVTDLIGWGFDYTWQLARGNSSDPNETATRAAAGEDPRPRVVPFDWDQRHTANLTVTMSHPDVFTASAIVRAVSGQPYTPSIASGFGLGLEKNAGRKPAAVVVDLRGERQSRWFGVPVSLFARAFNAFDAKYFNGFVFASSGSPFYSTIQQVNSPDLATLANPTRLYAPRRVEVGLTLRSPR